MLNALTVDVEDYFQVQAFAGHIDQADWENLPRRVEHNTNRVLDLFAETGAKATFFTLGWVAERHPELIRRMVDEGHEVASHGMKHDRVFEQSRDQFSADASRARALLEDVSGVAVTGYRAASFSINGTTPWAHDVLAEAGYRYSSSVYPIRHDLYGTPGGTRFRHQAGESGMTEIPVSTVKVMGRQLPCGGGGYFRLFPYSWFRAAWRRVNATDGEPIMLYFHPWEIDPDQPRQDHAPLKSRFRHYTNLSKMEGKLRRALEDFSWGRMDQVFLDDR